MADVTGVPSAGELAALPAAELAARLTEAYRVIAELTAQVGALSAQVEDLKRQGRGDSATSSRPLSSDSPYKKKTRDRSLRERGKRRPGKQPGDPGTTMKLIGDPDGRFWFPPATCSGCGAGLAGVEVLAQRRHQVTDIEPWRNSAIFAPVLASIMDSYGRTGRRRVEHSAGTGWANAQALVASSP